MTVKELMEVLSEFPDDALIVTSSHANAWVCFENAKAIHYEEVYKNGSLYEYEHISGEPERKTGVVVVE